MSVFDAYSPPKHRQLDVLYQDEYLIALNKPDGLLSVPGRGEHKQDCLSNRVKKDYPEAKVIHRLDMPTSGVILFALSDKIQTEVSRQFENRMVNKTYIAVVDGQVINPEGEIVSPLICDWPNRPKQKVDHEHGKQAITEYKVLSRDARDKTTRLELSPKTGRSHQLRVHMASIGHPILGDNLYANKEASQKANRLLLHASELSFKHPTTGRNIQISSECPF